MEKLCVFCGESPDIKTNEHIIPLWLIELTGDLNRPAFFGFKKWFDPSSGERKFSFDSFQFPACSSCNNEYSKLEAEAKIIINKILSEDALSAYDMDMLLDWLDKIRIGLWLGYRYLDSDPGGVNPHYHIRQRIGYRDRLVLILKTDNVTKGLNFGGMNTPLFWYTPCCFFLRINSYWFLNISFNDILSRRIGFPYMTDVKSMRDGRLEYKLNNGRLYMLTPLLKKWFTLKGTELYQPIFNGHIGIKEDREYYNNQYVREKCLDFEQGIGKIFKRDINNSITEYPLIPSKAWIPSETYSFQYFINSINILTLEWQYNINNSSKTMMLGDKKDQWKQNSNLKNAILFNKKLIEIEKEKLMTYQE
jgi:hypothetical protein